MKHLWTNIILLIWLLKNFIWESTIWINKKGGYWASEWHSWVSNIYWEIIEKWKRYSIFSNRVECMADDWHWKTISCGRQIKSCQSVQYSSLRNFFKGISKVVKMIISGHCSSLVIEISWFSKMVVKELWSVEVYIFSRLTWLKGLYLFIFIKYYCEKNDKVAHLSWSMRKNFRG